MKAIAPSEHLRLPSFGLSTDETSVKLKTNCEAIPEVTIEMLLQPFFEQKFYMFSYLQFETSGVWPILNLNGRNHEVAGLFSDIQKF